MAVVQGRLPLALWEALASGDAEIVAAAGRVAALPSPDHPPCPFCVVLAALPWPEYGAPKLCGEHLVVARALQCKGWNADRWHQHLAALARWGRLPDPVEWWPAGGKEVGEGE